MYMWGSSTIPDEMSGRLEPLLVMMMFMVIMVFMVIMMFMLIILSSVRLDNYL